MDILIHHPIKTTHANLPVLTKISLYLLTLEPAP
jgi:hypothetical protein